MTTAAVIQHVVIIVQENRTTDNLFQDPILISQGADIASSGINSLGQSIPLDPIDLGTTGSNAHNYDLSTPMPQFVNMYDGGKMDGADKIACNPVANCPANAHPIAFDVRQSCRRSALLRFGRTVHVRRPHVPDQPGTELSRAPVHHLGYLGPDRHESLICCGGSD